MGPGGRLITLAVIIAIAVAGGLLCASGHIGAFVLGWATIVAVVSVTLIVKQK